MDDVIAETADPMLAAIQGAVEANSEPTDEQAEVAADVEAAPAEDAAAEAPEAKAEEPPKTEDEEAALKALEAELVSKEPRIARGRIGVSRHQAVLTRNRNKWDEERKALTTQIETLKKQTDDPEVKKKLDLIKLAETDAQRFFGALKQTPAYQALIQAEIEAAMKSAKPAAPEKVEEPDETEPQPDVLLQDGRVTYSPEQAVKLAKWTSSQIAKKYGTELEKVRGEVKPIIEERQHLKSTQVAIDRMTKLIDKARAEWPGFKEHEAKIGELMRRPESIQAGMSVHEAYIAVVPSELAKQQAAVQAAADKKAVETLQQRVPKETIRPGSVPIVKAESKEGPMDTEAIIRGAMKSAGLSAA